jgi:hypothetical protein
MKGKLSRYEVATIAMELLNLLEVQIKDKRL